MQTRSFLQERVCVFTILISDAQRLADVLVSISSQRLKPMEELLELKSLILKQDYHGALALVDELEEMSKKDIINNIRSYAVILLLHIIKQIVEQRSTKSWDASISVSVLEIHALNQRRKSKGTYLDAEDLKEAIESAYAQAVIKASVEVFGGRLSVEEIESLAPMESVVAIALEKLKD